MQELVTSIRGAGGRVYIIDDGKSFKNSTILQGGKFIEIGADISINPFTMFDWKCIKKDPDYKNDIQNFFVSLLIQICRPRDPITPDEKALLELAIWNVLEKKKKKGSLKDIYKELLKVCDDDDSEQKKAAKSLRITLKVFIKKYNHYFTGKSDINTHSKLIAFELSNLKGSGMKDLKSCVMMILMHLIGETIYKGDRKTRSSLVIDEAWDLLHGEGMKDFIGGYVRRVRKYGGNLITGTQSINDYYKNDAARSVLENTQTKIFLSQNIDAIDYLKTNNVIKMNNTLEESLKRLRMVEDCYSEVLIYSNSSCHTARLVLDPFSIFLYSSKAEDVAALEDLKKQGLTLEQAINKLAGIKEDGFKKENKKNKEEHD
jgi:conjugal transfer ATP-binding protein TraC